MMPEQKNILNARNTDDDRVCSNIISFSNFYTGPRIFVRRVNFVIYSFMYAFSSKTYHLHRPKNICKKSQLCDLLFYVCFFL